MFENYVAMGEYYHSENNTLVKTICRAYEATTNEPMIAYAYVKEGGYVSDVYVMAEKDFTEKYSL